MDIVGRSERAVDRVVWEDDYLNVESLLKLADRLAATREGEQFLFREVELDCMFRQAAGELHAAGRSGDRERLDRAKVVRGLVFAAHDFVGVRDLVAAIATLSRLTDVVLGVEDLGTSAGPERA